MRRLLALAALLAAAAGPLGGCGGTLYTAEGLPVVAQGSTCDTNQVSCPTATGSTCVTETELDCGTCGFVCTGTLPANTFHDCRAHQCSFKCADGFLRTATGCESAGALAAGDAHTCAITSTTGLLKCWGNNGSGQVPGGVASLVATPQDSGLTGASAVAAGGTHTCAVIAGEVDCWPASAKTGMPAMVGVTALSAGATHTCAIVNGSTTRDVRCWGTGAAATAPPLSGVGAITSGANHACAAHGGGVTCWGDNARSQTGGGTPIAAGSGITSIAAGQDFTCAANFDATTSPEVDLRCWGDNSAGQLPQLSNPQVTPATPQRTGGGGGGGRSITKDKQLQLLFAGATHACVGFLPLEADGLGCFGDDTWGKSGGTFLGELVALGAVWGGTTVAAAGGDHTCAVEPGTGAVKCWGRNDSGELGIGAADGGAHASPLPVSGR